MEYAFDFTHNPKFYFIYISIVTFPLWISCYQGNDLIAIARISFLIAFVKKKTKQNKTNKKTKKTKKKHIFSNS